MPVGSTTVIEEKSYDNVVDIRNKIPDFNPNHYPGNYVPVSLQTRTTFTKQIDFLNYFLLFMWQTLLFVIQMPMSGRISLINNNMQIVKAHD